MKWRSALFLAFFTGVTASAAAQSAEPIRAGGGLTVAKGGGVGITGGILVPVKDLGIRTIGVVGAGSVLGFEGYHVVSLGGGVRWTRKLDEVASVKNFRIFGQGLLGFAHYPGDFAATDKAFNFGFGAGFSVNPKLDVFAEADVARLFPSDFDAYSAFVVTFGVSTPIGKK